MQQITIQVADEQQARQVVKMLSGVNFIDTIDVDPMWSPSEQESGSRIRIIESDMGPMISESRVSVYDVMEASDEGYGLPEIRQIYNLSSHQVEVALAYIEEHRSVLEPELKEIQQTMAEREKYYRALAAEREAQIPSEMTPERVALKALIAESRRKRGVQ